MIVDLVGLALAFAAVGGSIIIAFADPPDPALVRNRKHLDARLVRGVWRV